jgi:hypothetical protein
MSTTPEVNGGERHGIRADFAVEDHGSLLLVRPLTSAAWSWLEQNVEDDAQWFGGALAVESRYISNLLSGLEAAGFSQA